MTVLAAAALTVQPLVLIVVLVLLIAMFATDQLNPRTLLGIVLIFLVLVLLFGWPVR